MTSALNNSCSYANGKVTLYEYVFGLDFDCPYIDIANEHKDKVVTVSDLSNYSSKHDGLREDLKSQGFDIDVVMKSKNMLEKSNEDVIS